MIHELKIDPQYYQRIANGSKTFEVRENDRGFQLGDTVVLKEFDRTQNSQGRAIGYTGSPDLKFKIGYVHVLNTCDVVFSLLPLDHKDK